ncbi:MAG: bifunctional folylpolyglutamate synthase/dihydrofolate synthase, partial [Bacteroidia bacterium]
MDFKQTLNFLFNQLPIFQNQGKSAFNKDLGKTIALCKAIGNPQNSLNFIHIAGTNGKGSVCHMLASVLKQSGLKTGLYTSPHLLDFRERIRINGEYISKAFVVEFIESIKHEIETIKPSFFELTFAMALKYFEFQKTDIVVLETGMGGRLDSTNIVTPILSIITNIGLDHQMYLGNSIKAIAKEKAGIIKHQIPALLTDEQPEVIEIFKQTCTLNHSEGYFTSKKVTLSEDSPIQIQLTKSSSVSVNSPFVAKYQRENISTVAAAFSILRNKLNLNENDLKLGIEQVQLNFKLIGRWQLLSKNPRVIIDVGHNKDGITQILSQLKLEKYNA